MGLHERKRVYGFATPSNQKPAPDGDFPFVRSDMRRTSNDRELAFPHFRRNLIFKLSLSLGERMGKKLWRAALSLAIIALSFAPVHRLEAKACTAPARMLCVAPGSPCEGPPIGVPCCFAGRCVDSVCQY